MKYTKIAKNYFKEIFQASTAIVNKLVATLNVLATLLSRLVTRHLGRLEFLPDVVI